MMTYLDALILGIVEGITEFLPISSTGHMILASHMLNIGTESFTKSFEIIIQLGAILAVVYLYRQKVFRNMKLMFKVCVAFLPTAIIGLALYSIVKKYLLGNVYVVIASLFIGGLIILFFEKKYKTTQDAKLDVNKLNVSIDEVHTSSQEETLTESSISIKQALYIGLFQAIAIIPGVSRSAATIIGGQILGLSRKIIVEFSFLLAIPVMCAATALDIYKHHDSFSSGQFMLLSVGFVTAFLVALLAIKTFLSYIQKHSFAVFGYYRIILAIVFLGVLYFI
jgi:undecaprenyl-diphosphatase